MPVLPRSAHEPKRSFRRLKSKMRIHGERLSLTRELDVPARAGLVKRRRGALEIRDVPRLARLVEEVDGQ